MAPQETFFGFISICDICAVHHTSNAVALPNVGNLICTLYQYITTRRGQRSSIHAWFGIFS